jgi:hypothetical protein
MDIARSEQTKRVNDAMASLWTAYWSGGDAQFHRYHTRQTNVGSFRVGISRMRERLDTVVGLHGGPIPSTTDSGIEWGISPDAAGDEQKIRIVGKKGENRDITEISMDGSNEKPFPAIINPAVKFVDRIVTASMFRSFGHSSFGEFDTQTAMRVAEEFFDALVEPWEEAYGLKPLRISADKHVDRVNEKWAEAQRHFAKSRRQVDPEKPGPIHNDPLAEIEEIPQAQDRPGTWVDASTGQTPVDVPTWSDKFGKKQ